MGIGPVPSTKKLMERLGLKIGDFDWIELNEAFASQSLACLRQLGLPDDAEHVNPNGGAIALGHPLGMSGTRLAITATHQTVLTGAKRGLATMCVGVGQGVSLRSSGCSTAAHELKRHAASLVRFPHIASLMGYLISRRHHMPMSAGYIPFHPNPSKPKYRSGGRGLRALPCVRAGAKFPCAEAQIHALRCAEGEAVRAARFPRPRQERDRAGDLP
jgi:hypothetical protein